MALQTRKHFLRLTLIALISVLLGSCAKKSSAPFSFAFYNVENLFDTIDDPRIRDNSHLPDATVAWTSQRYHAKQDSLAKVIAHIDTLGFPALLGLCEVENFRVVNELVNNPLISRANYEILHQDSPDGRGIDVALLYQSKVYTPIQTRFIHPDFPIKPGTKTREILYSKGLVYKKDTLHVFINHWMSRWGGQEETEPFRRHTAQTIRIIADSILKAQPKANIIIAGDLNDNPDDLSIKDDLGASLPVEDIQQAALYNLSWEKYKRGEGTLYYRSWDMFDQIIVSGNLLMEKKGLSVINKEQEIIKYDWMLYTPEEGPARPSRTAGSKSYYGGFSDHLPILVRLQIK